jgi:sec-independent protein translocase protein TatC
MRTRRLEREEEATLVEHLEELRGRIMVALAALAVATAVAFVFHDSILDWLARPLPAGHRHLAAFGVAEPFSVSLSVSLYAESCSRCRCFSGRRGRSWLRRSALRPSAGFSPCPRSGSCSRRRASRSVTGILVPRAVHWLVAYDPGHFRLMIRASSYYSFVVSVLLGVVAVFELPLIVLALVNLGVLTSATLRRNRRRGYFLVAVAALALPGPDPVTTVLELLPMWALFEGSIWLAVVAERRAAKLSVVGAQA